MKSMKTFLVLSLISSMAFAQVDCKSVPAASCLSEEGMCLEFFEGGMGDSEMWEGMCTQMAGVYSETPCDSKKSILKCLTVTNPISPIIQFQEPMELEEAETTCKMLQGTVCPKLPVTSVR